MILNPIVSGGGGGVETVTVNITCGIRRSDIDVYYAQNGQSRSQNIMDGGAATIQIQSGGSILIRNNGGSSFTLTGQGTFDYTGISEPGSVATPFMFIAFFSDATITVS